MKQGMCVVEIKIAVDGCGGRLEGGEGEIRKEKWWEIHIQKL